jgi:hypothetical protein
MRSGPFLLLAALGSMAACATPRARSDAAACPPRPQTAALRADLRRVAADTALIAELGRVIADTARYADLRRAVDEPATTTELRRLLADADRMAPARPQIAGLEREVARLSACWRD